MAGNASVVPACLLVEDPIGLPAALRRCIFAYFTEYHTAAKLERLFSLLRLIRHPLGKWDFTRPSATDAHEALKSLPFSPSLCYSASQFLSYVLSRWPESVCSCGLTLELLSCLSIAVSNLTHYSSDVVYHSLRLVVACWCRLTAVWNAHLEAGLFRFEIWEWTLMCLCTKTGDACDRLRGLALCCVGKLLQLNPFTTTGDVCSRHLLPSEHSVSSDGPVKKTAGGSSAVCDDYSHSYWKLRAIELVTQSIQKPSFPPRWISWEALRAQPAKWHRDAPTYRAAKRQKLEAVVLQPHPLQEEKRAEQEFDAEAAGELRDSETKRERHDDDPHDELEEGEIACEDGSTEKTAAADDDEGGLGSKEGLASGSDSAVATAHHPPPSRFSTVQPSLRDGWLRQRCDDSSSLVRTSAFGCLRDAVRFLAEVQGKGGWLETVKKLAVEGLVCGDSFRATNAAGEVLVLLGSVSPLREAHPIATAMVSTLGSKCSRHASLHCLARCRFDGPHDLRVLVTAIVQTAQHSIEDSHDTFSCLRKLGHVHGRELVYRMFAVKLKTGEAFHRKLDVCPFTRLCAHAILCGSEASVTGQPLPRGHGFESDGCGAVGPPASSAAADLFSATFYRGEEDIRHSSFSADYSDFAAATTTASSSSSSAAAAVAVKGNYTVQHTRDDPPLPEWLLTKQDYGTSGSASGVRVTALGEKLEKDLVEEHEDYCECLDGRKLCYEAGRYRQREEEASGKRHPDARRVSTSNVGKVERDKRQTQHSQTADDDDDDTAEHRQSDTGVHIPGLLSAPPPREEHLPHDLPIGALKQRREPQTDEEYGADNSKHARRGSEEEEELEEGEIVAVDNDGLFAE